MSRRYLALSSYLRERFGCRVRSVTIDAGFTCPNVDGTITTGGCVYCDNRSFSPNRRLPRSTVSAQVQRGVTILTHRYRAERFIAYFQAGTNTHGSLEKLRRLYDEALGHPQVIGLAIGTRPDSVPDAVLDLLQNYASRVPVFLELGLQTVHDRSLEWMNRGHGVDAFLDAVHRCQGRGLDVCAHVILGLPGESPADMMETADVLAGLPVDGVKLHNLYVVRDTPLEKQYREGRIPMLTKDEYVRLVVDFIERTPADRVIHRLSGEAPPEFLVAPEWVREKDHFLRAVDEEFERRGTRQGQYVNPRRMRRKLSLPLVGE
ncbi:MAG: TIGR01212 family radical SAM protein [Planctomycetia bacterium]|nr:TIGR01212 family radical SAM protein [Planctomycetia bacterium]